MGQLELLDLVELVVADADVDAATYELVATSCSSDFMKRPWSSAFLSRTSVGASDGRPPLAMNVAAAGRRSQNCSGLRVGVDAFQELPNGRQAGSAGLEGGQVETAPPRERLLHLEQVLGAHAVGDERRLAWGRGGWRG